MATEPLLAIVKAPGIHGRGHGAGGCRADLLRGLLRQVSRMLRQASLLLPWLLCLLGSWSGGLQMEPGFGWLWDLELSPVLLAALGVVAMVASSALGVVTMVSQQRPVGVRADLGPVLAALALLLWHLGVSRQPGTTERWCVAVVTRAASAERPLGLRALDRSAAIGLFLLDDMLRAVLRFVAGTPSEAWPFALADRTCHSLWSSDEEWWAACYRGAGWMRLPSPPKSGAPRARPEDVPRRLLREAMLWASMMAETLGIMVVLQPRCATQCWAAAPCVASTLLVVSCAPWLPRQSEIVLMEMLQLMRIVGRVAVYFQAVWIAALALLLQPNELSMCAFPKDGAAPLLRGLEASALAVLYILIAGHLWAVTARCRAAAPLYAVPAEDVVSDSDPDQPARSSRPLYCGGLGPGGLGIVEGSYAPTRMCDWEALAQSPGVRWRDRYALRRCAELLTSREAHLLSYNDALAERISEAESEALGSAMATLWCVRTRAALVLLAALAAGLCVAMSIVALQPSCRAPTLASLDHGRGAFEALLWLSLLARVGRSWFSLASQGFTAWDTAGCAARAEALELRQQACSLNRSLAETQWMLGRLELRLEDLGARPRRPGLGGLGGLRFGAGGCCRRRRLDQADDGEQGGALRALALGWLVSLSLLALPPQRW